MTAETAWAEVISLRGIDISPDLALRLLIIKANEVGLKKTLDGTQR